MNGVAQVSNLSVSPEIVAPREDFFNHGRTRINTDGDSVSLIRVHPCSSVVGSYWLRLGRAAQYRRLRVGKPWVKRVALALRGHCGLEIRDTAQRGGAATEHTLSSMQWRRGSGRGGAPLLDPLPAPASRGEEEENALAENRRGLRRFGPILIDLKSALRAVGIGRPWEVA
jgi:hypothetical protein